MNKGNSLSLIIIAVALFLLFGKPQLASLADARQQESDLNKSLADLQAVDQKKAELLAKMNSLSPADLNRINTMLPDKPEVTSLVAEIDGLASKYGIELHDISTGPNPSFAATPTDNLPTKAYQATSLSFKFDANYSNMKAFIADLESSLRLLDIRSIDSSPSQGGTYTYQVALDIYWLTN